MARVKIKFPYDNPLAVVLLPVRITDINYGGHLGNDALLSIIHESRMQWLAGHGFTELDAGGHGLIMADVMIAYRGEAFYGDTLKTELFVAEISPFSFDLLYRISTAREGTISEVAHAKTGMVCFDYNNRAITAMSEGLKSILQASKL